MEFRNGNTFGTVAYTAYGAFWRWYAFLIRTIGAGLVLLLWGVFTMYMWIATFRSISRFGLSSFCYGLRSSCWPQAIWEWARVGIRWADT